MHHPLQLYHYSQDNQGTQAAYRPTSSPLQCPSSIGTARRNTVNKFQRYRKPTRFQTVACLHTGGGLAGGREGGPHAPAGRAAGDQERLPGHVQRPQPDEGGQRARALLLGIQDALHEATRHPPPLECYFAMLQTWHSCANDRGGGGALIGC